MIDMISNVSECKNQRSYELVVARLGARVAYRSRRSGLGPGIGLGQANFYSAGLGAG